MISHEYKFIFAEKEDAEQALELVMDKVIKYGLDIKYLALFYYENKQEAIYSADRLKGNYIGFWYELTFLAKSDLTPPHFVNNYFSPLKRFWAEKELYKNE